MYRREWLAATAVGCGVSVAGCSALFDDKQSPTDSDGNEQPPADGNGDEQSSTDGDSGERPSTDGDSGERPPADGDSDEQSSTGGDDDEQLPADSDGERSSITESQRARVVDEIQAVEQSTAKEIASIEASARNEITDIRNTTIRKIELLEGHSENWLRRPNSKDGSVLVDTIEDFVRKIQRAAEKGRERIQTVSDWKQRAIERAATDGQAEIEAIPSTRFDSEPDDEIQTAVGNLETSAQESKQAIDTAAQEARTAIDETAQQSVENLESGLASL